MAREKGTSKKNTTVTINGLLDVDEDTITEITKNADLVYNFKEILRQFNGKDISLTIKESTELDYQ
jgi:hypothetical protein